LAKADVDHAAGILSRGFNDRVAGIVEGESVAVPFEESLHTALNRRPAIPALECVR
jgi:hypothetical protein